MTNKKKHLSDEERFCIEKMCKAGTSQVEMGRILGRGKSTISEEISANGGRKKYNAQKAIHRAYLKQYRKKRDCNKVALDGHLVKFVEKKLSCGWSPETISSRLETQSGLQYASSKSIRKFVEKRSGLERYLFWNRNHKKSGRPENKIYLTDPDRKWINDRPQMALFEYGHWEMDFIVSKQSPYVLLVCVEKYSKILRLKLLPNRNNHTVNQAVHDLLKGYVVHSITTDNDIAFSKWKELETLLHTNIYFCEPYHSWEKGLVENCNRWIREFIPKKTDLQSISLEFVAHIELYFNHKPREVLNGYTSYEVMMKKEYGRLVESLEINFPVRIGW
jgi:IS30 family transposase